MLVSRFTYRNYLVVLDAVDTDGLVRKAKFSRLDGLPMRAEGDPGFVPSSVSAHRDQVVEAACRELNNYEDRRFHRLDEISC